MAVTEKSIERVREMETLLTRMQEVQSRLSEAIEDWHDALPDYQRIVKYYTGPRWMRDREDSDNGLFPDDLPQGCLSEDLIYNMMMTQRELAIQTAKVAIKAIEKA